MLVKSSSSYAFLETLEDPPPDCELPTNDWVPTSEGVASVLLDKISDEVAVLIWDDELLYALELSPLFWDASSLALLAFPLSAF